MSDQKQAKRVCITGAAGQIGYSLIFLIARGEMLGKDQPVILQLLDIPPMQQVLEGVCLEIEDCAFPLVKEVIATTNPEEGFKDTDYAILVGAFPRREGMERKDLLEKNAAIFKSQGKVINEKSSKNIKVLVVGNPANTNALITMTCAPDIPKENFSALTRLDHNRAKNQLAKKGGVDVTSVKKAIIWGNHSSTQYPDARFAESNGKKLTEIVNDQKWVEGEFVTTVQKRGAAIIEKRKFSSAASAAKAIVDHMISWVFGTPDNDWVSMGVASDGSYGIKEGIIFSYPVTVKDGKWSVVKDLKIDEFSQKKLDATEKELRDERETAFGFLGLK